VFRRLQLEHRDGPAAAAGERRSSPELEGQAGVVMLSGGEPTIHPDFPALVRELADRNIVRILINTNGVVIARDDGIASLLQELNHRVEVYLQFDGFRPATHRTLRGADLSRLKQTAIRRLTQAEVFTTLVMTVAKGVNDEIGDVPFTRYSVHRRASYQRFCLGRGDGIDPMTGSPVRGC
jgi:uncharacterized radical SAM superfamily Fe-S cluster-containing enzyme